MPRVASWSGNDARWSAALVATFAAILIINPIGYVGGAWDDWHYLNAARCWQEHGPCVPRSHWEGRWPVFMPVAVIFTLLGESRLTLGIWPLLASAGAIALLVTVGNRALGRPVGYVAGILFLVTPAFSAQLLAPRPEPIELAFILGGIHAVLVWHDRRTTKWAFLAGLYFAGAFQVRETSLVAGAFAAIYVVTLKPRSTDIAAASIGFLAPLAIELFAYWAATGDALFRRHLSVAHTQILSSELLGPIDRHGLPFFNGNYIANWRHEPGLHLHWLVDGMLNLLVNAKGGMTMLLAPALWFYFRNALEPRVRLAIAMLYGAGIAYAAVLIYVLAIDPKARVMLVPFAASNLAFAGVAMSAWREGRRLIPNVMASGQLVVSLTLLFAHQRTFVAEPLAAAWLARYPGQIEVEPNTRRHLELVHGIREAPNLDSESPYLLYASISPCDRWPRRALLPPNSLELMDEQPLSQLSKFGWETGSLCVYRYRLPLSAEIVRSGIRRSRRDGEFILDPRSYLSATRR